MAYSLINHTAFGSLDFATGTTPAIDTTSANLLALFVSNSGGGYTVSDSKTNSWTPLTRFEATAPPGGQWFYCESPSVGGGHTFSIAAGNAPSIYVLAFSGGKTGSFDQENGNNTNGVSPIQPGSVTPSENNELLLCGVTLGGGSGAVTVDSGFIKTDQVDFNGAEHFGGAVAYLIQTTGTAENPTWTFGTPDISTAVIETFKSGLIIQKNAIFFGAGTTS